MKKLFILILSVTCLLASSVVTPVQQIKVNGVAKDMVLRDNTLIVATDNGAVQVYDYEAKVFSKIITLPKVKDFIGDLVPARIFSVDKLASRYVLVYFHCFRVAISWHTLLYHCHSKVHSARQVCLRRKYVLAPSLL